MTSRKRKRAARAPNGSTPTTYVESSALLSAFLERDVAARRAMRAAGRLVSSALTLTEAYRAVIRARVSGRMQAEQERVALRGLRTFAQRCELLTITNEVLERAGRPFPVEPIRTLDAIHLASIEILDETPQLVTVVTRDIRVAQNARALGYTIA
ncbi:MAG: type II toxin-antitoxin system VapC family toxin [Gemmatimonadaceae bacterium]